MTRATLGILFASIFAAASVTGCIIVTDGSTSGGGFGGNGGTGGQGTGGTEAQGTGGAGVGGTGGQGTGGAGGAGGQGGSGCVDPAGTGKTGASCDMMNITPKSHGGAALSTCGATKDQDPPGYGTCVLGFKIYRPGDAETLQSCLAKIGVEPANACDIKQVSTCVNTMYKAACENPTAVKACNDLATVTCKGEPFDTQKCMDYLLTFNSDGLNKVAACMAASDPAKETCLQAFDRCFGEATTF
jgi:hypothetical protein